MSANRCLKTVDRYNSSQLFVWRQQLAASAARDAPGFVPVLVTDEGTVPAEPGGRIEIVLGPAVGMPPMRAAAVRT